MKILNFGSCNIDYVYALDHVVAAGETQQSNGLNVFPGGKGLNQSIAAARAGAEVYHAGCIGEDGGFLAELLQTSGVYISYLQQVDGKNGHAIIQVTKDGENCIVLYAGSNAAITKEQVDDVLKNFGSGDLLLLQNEINLLDYIVERAYEKGMQIALNPSPIDENIAKIDFAKLSYLILNEVEAAALSGFTDEAANLAYFQQRYPKLKVMLTLGKRGCIYQDGERQLRHPIFAVEAVDTTAAGDTFTGYFLAGIAAGMDCAEVIKRASCASAISVSKHGAAPSIPDLKSVEYGLKTMRVKEL